MVTHTIGIKLLYGVSMVHKWQSYYQQLDESRKAKIKAKTDEMLQQIKAREQLEREQQESRQDMAVGLVIILLGIWGVGFVCAVQLFFRLVGG